MEAHRWSEADGFEAHSRFLTKASNPHRLPKNPAFQSLIPLDERARLADAWDQGWDRAELLRRQWNGSQLPLASKSPP